jgi:uncharacterized protein
MSLVTAETLAQRVREHALQHEIRQLAIGLHGGEPLLVGPRHLDALVSTFRRELTGFDLHISLQTNAVLISERVSAVARKHDVKVSISLDGFELANQRRLDLRGRSSFAAAMRGIDLAKKYMPDQLTGMLAVIDVKSPPLEVFDFMGGLGVDHIDFLLPHHNWERPPLRITNRQTEYGEWLWAIFEAWTSGRHSKLTIRFFENIVRNFLREQSNCEAMSLAPVSLITVNTDGGLEGVDTLKSTGSGLQITGLNIFDNSFDDVFANELVALRQSGLSQLSSKCRRCQHVSICAGGYFPHRYSGNLLFDNPSVYCADLFWLLDRMTTFFGLRADNSVSTATA